MGDVRMVRRDRLVRLKTQDLIDQYRIAIMSNRGRYSNTGQRQTRINMIVDELASRADRGDAVAEQWIMS